jgi:hypothetical protein
LGGTNVPRWIPSAREGDLKEEEMASHEDRKQKNARFWQMWLVGGFGQIENWQILADFFDKMKVCVVGSQPPPTSHLQPVVNFSQRHSLTNHFEVIIVTNSS